MELKKLFETAKNVLDALKDSRTTEDMASLFETVHDVSERVQAMFSLGKEVADDIVRVFVLAQQAADALKGGTRGVVKPLDECTSVDDLAAVVAAHAAE